MFIRSIFIRVYYLAIIFVVDRYISRYKNNLIAYAQKQPCVKWGNQFDISLETHHLQRDCKLPDGRSICCAAVYNNISIADYSNTPALHSNTQVYNKGIGHNFKPSRKFFKNNQNYDLNSMKSHKCVIYKEYISSPLELYDLEVAKEIERIPGDLNTQYMIPERYEYLMNYVTSDDFIKNSTLWLNRVKLHMQSPHPLPTTVEDTEFLSRFIYTRKCGSSSSNNMIIDHQWTEWIEPIGITLRHPFAFGTCRQTSKYYNQKQQQQQHRKIPRIWRSNVDYVLLQSGAALYNQTHSKNTGKRIHLLDTVLVDQNMEYLTSTHKNILMHRQVANKQYNVKHYMLDAGTSTFDSSLFWFTCAYSQRHVGFDAVYAWEMTLLEPNDYWRRVPEKWKPYWHFYNVPITSGIDSPDSPLRLIRNLATASDFIAFKLDIDHPAMEMPIALSLLNDPAIFQLVDEFFFELHFRCEVMTSCGWGKKVPVESHGLELIRSKVMQFFIDLRKRGIRAHPWP